MTTQLPPQSVGMTDDEKALHAEKLKQENERRKQEELANPGVKTYIPTYETYNIAAAFCMFARGVTLPEIAAAWKIKFERLNERRRRERWDDLVKRYGNQFQPAHPEPTPPSAGEVAVRQKKIEDNRDLIVRQTDGLLRKIQELIEKRGQEWDAKTIRDLAQAVKSLGEISMTARGDEYAIKAAANSVRSPQSKGPAITINLPSMLTAPRQVVDIAETVNELEKRKQLYEAARMGDDPAIVEADANDEEEKVGPVQPAQMAVEPEGPNGGAGDPGDS